MAQQLTPARFIAKWSPIELSERAASQEHFIDLCRMLGQPTPAEHDATGAEYTFEKGVATTGAASRGTAGVRGFADVWWKGKFGWEYKRRGKYRNLDEAYRQLCQYREALENPPLLIVCDITHTEIHTNFTGTAKQVHRIELGQFDEPDSLDLLRRIFTDPNSFKPTVTTESVTQEVAEQFGELARSLRQWGHNAPTVAHFLMKCMFCLFAEDVGLLPNKLFERLLQSRRKDPQKLTESMTALFAEMKDGGSFGVDDVPYFNGGLFDDAPALQLTGDNIDVLLRAASPDWGSVEPAIFGTLFERSLDPNTRAQIGAHYTSREDIMLVVEPVVMAPLRREWESVTMEVEKQLARRRKVKTRKRAADKAIEDALQGFVHRLATVRILDPACGSGNFLYVAIQQLLDLEKEVTTIAARSDIAAELIPQVRPTQLYGIEINPYAAELAQVVIWIGYLQWMRDNGFNAPRDPILEPLQTIECRDAILDLSDPDNPKPAEWPEADFIIGNPPFLGCRQFRDSGLQDSYIGALWKTYSLPKTSDLCCYWFEHGRVCLQAQQASRIGLLATQGIRGTDNREVLVEIAREGAIFMAWSDRSWILDGADVRVSIIGYGKDESETAFLDGHAVSQINADLTSGPDIAEASVLRENVGIAFMGDTKGGAFELKAEEAADILRQPNPGVNSNACVTRPWINGGDICKRGRGMFIIDFGCDLAIEEASRYEAPFRLVERRVRPTRVQNRRASYAAKWWLHVEPRPAMRHAVHGLARFIVTPRVAKHRVFRWCEHACIPDSRIFVFATDDDYFLGVLQSSLHERWALRTCSWHGVGNDPTYNKTTCFETFPMPWPPDSGPTDDENYQRIAEAARELNEMRERWLNPPEWIDPIAEAVDAEDDFADVPQDARALIRHSAIMARAAKDKNLKKRTLTNLYNERPTWLKLAHEKLDRAVLSAYAATDPEGDWSEDWADVWKDTGAGFPLPDDHELSARRPEIDQLVLANLLRLNLARSEAG